MLRGGSPATGAFAPPRSVLPGCMDGDMTRFASKWLTLGRARPTPVQAKWNRSAIFVP